jgi:hypothetical protein
MIAGAMTLTTTMIAKMAAKLGAKLNTKMLAKLLAKKTTNMPLVMKAQMTVETLADVAGMTALGGPIVDM